MSTDTNKIKTFTETLSIGGSASEDQMKAFLQKLRNILAFGQISSMAANMIKSSISAVAEAEKHLAELQSQEYTQEANAAITGAAIQFGAVGTTFALGAYTSSWANSAASSLDAESAQCSELAEQLNQPATGDGELSVAPDNQEGKAIEMDVFKDNGVNVLDDADAGIEGNVDQKTIQEQTDRLLAKSTDEENSVNQNKYFPSKAKFGISAENENGDPQGNIKDVNKIAGQKEIIDENGETKQVDARKYYAEKFEKRAEELRNKSKAIREQADRKNQQRLTMMNALSPAAGSLTTAAYKLDKVAPIKEEEVDAREATAYSQAINSLATGLVQTAGSGVKESTDEAAKQAQINSGTQSGESSR